jgi:ankyrin repeat protein
MHKWIRAALIGLALGLPALSAAQFSDSYNFLKAVKEREGGEATKFLGRPGSVIIDTHDLSNGETALHIVTKDRDLQWLHFLLSKGAKPDTRDKTGETPLLIATRLNFVEGVEYLLAFHASVDATNNNGETALIRAVQINNVTLVKTLLGAGANPDRADHIAGMSARDYAKRDSRNPAMLQAFSDSKATKPKAKAGPSL